jgi:hypothetical protein
MIEQKDTVKKPTKESLLRALEDAMHKKNPEASMMWVEKKAIQDYRKLVKELGNMNFNSGGGEADERVVLSVLINFGLSEEDAQQYISLVAEEIEKYDQDT